MIRIIVLVVAISIGSTSTIVSAQQMGGSIVGSSGSNFARIPNVDQTQAAPTIAVTATPVASASPTIGTQPPVPPNISPSPTPTDTATASPTPTSTSTATITPTPTNTGTPVCIETPSTSSPIPRLDLTEADMRKKIASSLFKAGECSSLGADTSRSFPRSVIASTQFSPICLNGRCTSREYATLDFKNIENQHYGDGVKVYYMALIYKGGPNEFFNGENIEDREIFVGWQSFRARRFEEKWNEAVHGALARRGVIDIAPRDTGGNNRPYKWCPALRGNNGLPSCKVVYEYCYRVNEPEPYTIALSGDESLDFGNGANSVTYNRGDIPTFLGYVKTANYDINREIATLDAFETGLTFVWNVLPFFSTSTQAIECINKFDFECATAVSLDITSDVLTVVSFGLPARLIALRNTIKYAQFATINGNFALAAYHGMRGDWGKALGRSLAAGIDVGIVKYAKGVISFRSLRQKTTPSRCTTSSTELKTINSTRTCSITERLANDPSRVSFIDASQTTPGTLEQLDTISRGLGWTPGSERFALVINTPQDPVCRAVGIKHWQVVRIAPDGSWKTRSTSLQTQLFFDRVENGAPANLDSAFFVIWDSLSEASQARIRQAFFTDRKIWRLHEPSSMSCSHDAMSTFLGNCPSIFRPDCSFRCAPNIRMLFDNERLYINGEYLTPRFYTTSTQLDSLIQGILNTDRPAIILYSFAAAATVAASSTLQDLIDSVITPDDSPPRK